MGTFGIETNKTLPNKDLTLGTNQQSCGRQQGVYLIGKPMTTQPHKKQQTMILRTLFLPKSGLLSISMGSNRITSTWRDFLNTNVDCTWSNHWLHHNARSLLPTARTSNRRLAIEIWRWTIVPISRDTGLCHFCYYNVVEIEGKFCVGMSPIQPH